MSQGVENRGSLISVPLALTTQGPCHLSKILRSYSFTMVVWQNNTTVVKHYSRVSGTPCFLGENSQEISTASELIRVETFIACPEPDFENRPCAQETCAKLVRGTFPTDPRKFVRKMCGGIRKCAEIVRNLCGGAPAQFAQNIVVGFPRMCMHKFCAIFR